MESTIFEEIIYKGWIAKSEGATSIDSGRRGLRSAGIATPSTGMELQKTYRKLVQTLSNSEEEARERIKGVKFPREKLTAEQMLFQIERQQPVSMFEIQMLQLMELETYRLMGLVTDNVRFAESEDDRFYIVTLTMRKWCDYLVDLQNPAGFLAENDSHTKTLHEGLLKRLLVLICDLSERYTDLDLKECYDRENIYPLLLNRKAPEKPEIQPAPSFIEKRGAEMALHLLKNGPDETKYRNFLDELKMYACETGNSEYTLTTVIIMAVHHLENLLLLYLWQESSFIEENRKALTNPETAAEWVCGVREEALEIMNGEMEVTLKKLWSTKNDIQPYVSAVENTDIQDDGKKSEARRFIEEVEEMDRTFFGEPFGIEKVKGKAPKDSHLNPFIDQAGEKFMPKEHLYDYLGFGNANNRTTRSNFLKNAGFRYVEVTDQKHLVYIKDIEEYIEKNTKRYGDDK